jgi:signal peptidase II
VVDFLSIGWWPVFNVADPAVVGGAMLLLVLSVFGYEFDSPVRHRPQKPGPQKPSDPASEPTS